MWNETRNEVKYVSKLDHRKIVSRRIRIRVRGAAGSRQGRMESARHARVSANRPLSMSADDLHMLGLAHGTDKASLHQFTLVYREPHKLEARAPFSWAPGPCVVKRVCSRAHLLCACLNAQRTCFLISKVVPLIC